MSKWDDILESGKQVDWRKVVATVAPTLAAAFGGPLAGTAAATLSTAMFGKPDATEKEIAVALQSANPEMLAKIKAADQAFAVEMKKLDLDLERIAVGDRADARTRQIATNDWMPAVLGILVTIGFFGLLTAMFFWTPPVESESALQIMLGALGASYLSVVTYYFGSSAGSKQKTDMFGQMEKKGLVPKV